MPRRIIAIIGATATGKTALAIALAQQLGGEIINADSRQFYRGMDIGTAKPTAAERAAARHHLIDIANPDEALALGTYLDAARSAVDDIFARGARPIVVGGTGQYVWALLEGWQVPRVPPNAPLRARLEALAATNGNEAVVDELFALDPASANTIDPRNLRRLMRAIEVTLETGRPFSAWQEKQQPDFDASIIGLRLDRPTLHARIDERFDAMMSAGFLEEVRALIADGYHCDLSSMSAIGYRQLCEHIAGTITLPEAIARIKTETHRLARMQHTWFKETDPRIHWLDADDPYLVAEAKHIVSA